MKIETMGRMVAVWHFLSGDEDVAHSARKFGGYLTCCNIQRGKKYATVLYAKVLCMEAENLEYRCCTGHAVARDTVATLRSYVHQCSGLSPTLTLLKYITCSKHRNYT